MYMKHSFTAFVALTLLMALPVFTACMKDNSEGRFDATITVNPEPLYVELGMEGIDLLFMQKKITVVDSVLIYNQEGHLVNKLGAETSMFLNPMTIEADDLPVGTYTLVAWQTIVAHLNGKDLRGWHVVDESELSTVSIMANANPVSYIYALGYDSATLTIQNGAADVNLTPKAMGSNIHLTVINLPDEPAYSKVTLQGSEAKQLHPGLRLNPALNEEDRYIENTDPDLYDCVAYCHPKYGYTFFTLAHGDDLTLEFWGERKDGADDDLLSTLEPLRLEAGDHFTIYLNYQTRKWQPPFCGANWEVNQWINDGENGVLVTDPLLDWGCSIADVEKHIQAKPWWRAGNDGLDYREEVYASWHRYYYVAPELTEQYLFETEDGKNLRYVYCQNWCEDLPYDVAKNWLLRLGYQYQGTAQRPGDEDIFDRFISSDGKTVAYAMPDVDGYWYVIFEPNNK